MLFPDFSLSDPVEPSTICIHKSTRQTKLADHFIWSEKQWIVNFIPNYGHSLFPRGTEFSAQKFRNKSRIFSTVPLSAPNSILNPSREKSLSSAITFSKESEFLREPAFFPICDSFFFQLKGEMWHFVYFEKENKFPYRLIFSCTNATHAWGKPSHVLHSTRNLFHVILDN